MPDSSGRDLVGEWRRMMDAMIASAASLGGRAEFPKALVEPMQRQLELLEEVVARERRLQREVTSALVAPFDVVFDLLEQNGQMLRSQAEALEAAGHALGDAARLVKTQAELFERTISVLRQPTELAKAAAGLERRSSGTGATGGKAKSRTGATGGRGKSGSRATGSRGKSGSGATDSKPKSGRGGAGRKPKSGRDRSD